MEGVLTTVVRGYGRMAERLREDQRRAQRAAVAMAVVLVAVSTGLWFATTQTVTRTIVSAPKVVEVVKIKKVPQKVVVTKKVKEKPQKAKRATSPSKPSVTPVPSARTPQPITSPQKRSQRVVVTPTTRPSQPKLPKPASTPQPAAPTPAPVVATTPEPSKLVNLSVAGVEVKVDCLNPLC